MATLDEIAAGTDEELAELEAALGDSGDESSYAEGFRFEEPGDQIVGRVVETDTGETEYGEYPIVTVSVAGGDLRAIHGFGTVLAKRLKRAEVGDLIAVRFNGEKKGKGGRSYKDYKVVLRAGNAG